MHLRAAFLALVAGLLVAAGASGQLQQGDAEGDGEPDLRAVGWLEPVAGDLAVEAELPGGRGADGWVRLFWARGDAGSPEPAEWYLATVGNTTTVHAGHGGQSRAVTAETNWTASGVSVRFTRIDASAGACTVVAAESGTGAGSTSGFERSDVAPDRLETLDEMWPDDGVCPVQSAPPVDTDGEQDSPGLGVVLLSLALVAALAMRRR